MSAPNGEQRTTASIMFTDVVGFSKHSALNEERTFRALNRDFDIIYRQVAAHGGQVLNTMGDGMMVVFMSATACMQCALAIQGDLHRQSLSRPVDGVLQHRIGLHIGDIILNGKNTMGDGVNQAARIESLARPDSIAMSREFYKMVENKVQFTSKYLGPLRARNIPEAIPIHEVPPVDDVIKQKTAEALFSTASPEVNEGATGRRSAVILISVLLLLVLAAAPIYFLRTVTNIEKKGLKIPAGKADESIAKRIRDRVQGKKKAEEANNDASQSANNVPDANTAPNNSFSLTPDQLADIAAKTNAYDYAGAAAELRTIPGAASPEGMVMIKRYETLVQFKAWMDAEVTATTESTPISATIGGQPAKVYSSANGIVIDINGQITTKKLWQYDAQTVESIAEGLSASPPDATISSPEVPTWIGTFKEVHRLPQ